MTIRHWLPLAVLALGRIAHADQTRPLTLDDLFALKEVEDPRLSPDGKWVAYTVTSLDAKKDKSDTDIYMAPLAGGEPLRLTSGTKDETAPRFSPDGKWLAFLSGREGKKTQVWLLPRQGGEAVKLTDYKASVTGLDWSPDSKRLALVVADVDPDATDDADAGTGKDGEAKEEAKTAKPIVIRRLQFKQDYRGYLREVRRHIHVFDVVSRTSVQLSSGPYDDGQPAWSPDGKWIAFSSNRSPEPDANDNLDVFVAEATGGGVPRALTTSPGHDDGPVFSPDGRSVAYLAGGDPKHIWYAPNHVAVVPFAGGAPRPLTQALDRNVMAPRFTPDGKALLFLLEDGGNQHLARVPLAGGPVERVVSGERDIAAFDVGPHGELAFLESQPNLPGEVSTLEAGQPKRVTRTNDGVLKAIRLGRVERFQTRSADGTAVHGFLAAPPDAGPGPLPAILRIHGGPTSQYSTAFNFEWQILAAQGYLVIAANPRGSTGYGLDFSRAIFADWGNKDTQDVLAAVEHAVAKGLADPERLGVGGWSYGGMLTNYVITRSTRFKAAVSGASISNYLAGYGTDHYQYWYEAELGLPWKQRQRWIDLSTPFFDIEKVTTPTLFMCGEKDMNVPLLNTEQMYQALRRVGAVETELVIYPDQWHGIQTPSYQKDRYQRYIAWYDKHLRPTRAAPDRKPEATSLLGAPLHPIELAPDTKKRLEDNLARASADFVKNPDDADAIIWLGRRLAYLGRFQEAIAVFSRGVEKHPNDLRLLRHRGHRYITTRQLDKAVADLTRAAELAATTPDQVEPDGDPNPRGIPTGTSHYNVFYHLGLAHYLRGDFEKAAEAYRQCMKYSTANADNLTATSDWLYMTLMRLGRRDEAAALLEPIRADMEIVENRVYLNRLLMYKGVRTPDELLRAGGDPITQATYGYAVGNWYLYNGQHAQAKEAFERVTKTPQWAAFGYIAAEAELARQK